MKTFMYSAIAMTMLFFNVSSYASLVRSNGQQPDGIQTLSFDGLRGACKDPSRYHNQISPSNIQVSCQDIQYKWVPAEDGSINLKCKRQVTTSVMSDKYAVNPETSNVKATSQSGSCPRFKKVSETVTFTKNATCEELLAFTGTGTDYCSGLINNIRADNPQSIDVKDVGEHVDTCQGFPSDDQQD